MGHFNKLSPAEAERLAWLAEECAEVIQAIGKILRHGYESYDPSDLKHKGNRADLERELNDVLAAIGLMEKKGDISTPTAELPDGRTLRYMHHQGEDKQ